MLVLVIRYVPPPSFSTLAAHIAEGVCVSWHRHRPLLWSWSIPNQRPVTEQGCRSYCRRGVSIFSRVWIKPAPNSVVCLAGVTLRTVSDSLPLHTPCSYCKRGVLEDWFKATSRNGERRSCSGEFLTRRDLLIIALFGADRRDPVCEFYPRANQLLNCGRLIAEN